MLCTNGVEIAVSWTSWPHFEWSFAALFCNTDTKPGSIVHDDAKIRRLHEHGITFLLIYLYQSGHRCNTH